ncbi:MAG TPA: HAMP domain-containing protein, partial [Clostridia bacterium]
MKTIGSKLFVSFLLMAALTIGLLWLIQAGFMKDSYLKSRVGSVAAAVRQAANADAPDLETLKQEQNISLVQLGADGMARSMTQGMPMMGQVVRASQAMVPDRVDGTVQLLTSASNTGRYALLGYPVKSGGYLFAVFSLADVDEASRILRDQLWLITLLLLSFAVILAIVLSRRLARPIKAVTHAARELALGRLDVALPVKTRDEIGALTVALNELGIQLQNTENLRKELIANVSHELRAPLAVI